jgi:hypothetical protein
MKLLVFTVVASALVIFPSISVAQSVANSNNSSISAPTSPYPQGYPSYPPINNNGGIIQGISGVGGQCGTGIQAEIGYGNGSGGNTIYSGSSGIDPNTPVNKSELNGKFVFRHDFNPCFSGRKQTELQMRENCNQRKDQFIANNPNMSIDQLDLRLARFCGGGVSKQSS